MATIQRVIAITVTAAVLSGSGSWAYAAPAAGDERTGTWVALGLAAVVALVAGVAAVVGPSWPSGTRRPSVPGRPDMPTAPAVPGVPPARRMMPPTADFGEDDTSVQRALAAETRARRAHTEHRDAR